MKNIIFVAIAAFIFSSCSKDMQGKDEWVRPTVRPKPQPVLSEICVNSYADFVAALGAGSLNVKSALLADGTLLTVGTTPNLVSITYQAENVQIGNSLFKSLTVHTMNPYGYWQSNSSETWSLGCVYTNSGVGPFLNIRKADGTLILINSFASWGFAPHAGKRIVELRL